MNYLAITETAATWALAKVGLIDELHRLLLNSSDKDRLRDYEFVEGPVRISASDNGVIVAFWNVDYMSGSGDDPWGFIDLAALAARKDISREVLERCLYVVSQRLQGLLIEGAFIHRAYSNGAHTCLAGRGTDARHESIGYCERDALAGSITLHSIVVTGPQYDRNKLASTARKQADQLNSMVTLARHLYDPSRRKLSLPSSEFPKLRELLSGYFGTKKETVEFAQVSVPTGSGISSRSVHMTTGWTYAQWMASGSPLSAVQRHLLLSDAIYKHPVRIVGPGGSGKTLLMQLLALRSLELAAKKGIGRRLLYLVHNAKMAEMVRNRFSVLRGETEELAERDGRSLDILTLSEYGRKQLELEETQIIDPDAYEAKLFQLDVLKDALASVMASMTIEISQSKLFQEVKNNEMLQSVLIRLLMSEISTAIKGHGLATDERRYVRSDRPLSRLHGILNESERRIVFATFARYHRLMFDDYRVLDSDDVALSLLGKLRTPIWELKRRDLGYDHVFVDEMQLFNENERRLFAFLGKTTVPYVPIVFALDEAQDVYGQVSSGLATLGIENVFNESLSSIHRSSTAIIRLAFFVIQRSTDLFGPDFPDFTRNAGALPEDTSALAKPPRVEAISDPQQDYGRFVIKRVRLLRGDNLQRIAVVCLAEQYWSQILKELRESNLPVHVLEQRGQRLSSTGGIVVLSRPAHIGGQEFDAVVIAGAEMGLAPPRVVDNDALAAAVEQQTLRELYLAITRARYQLVFTLARGATLSPVLEDAGRAGLLVGP